jgi:protein-disulfide isomerase
MAQLIEGAKQSPVKVLIYEDLQCPDCATFRDMLDKQLLPRYGTKVRFEHRDFPLAKHSWARRASIAALYLEEAKPGVGREYRKYSLVHLRQIKADTFEATLSQFARDHGVDPAKAVASLTDERLAALVEKDYQEGVSRGIAHTPTILVNGRPFIETFSFDEVAKAIDEELAAAK